MCVASGTLCICRSSHLIHDTASSLLDEVPGTPHMPLLLQGRPHGEPKDEPITNHRVCKISLTGLIQILHEHTVGLIGILLCHGPSCFDPEAHKTKIPWYDHLEPVVS